MNAEWILAASVIGGLLGAFYFGGLWLTVRRVSTSRQPAMLIVASFLVRAGIVLSGFYLVTAGRWERWVACLAGFLFARSLSIRQLRDDGRASRTIAFARKLAG